MFEKTALHSLWKLMSRRAITTVDFPISTGKEGNVFRATSEAGPVAVKIYRLNTATFRNIAQYLQYDGLTDIKKNRRNAVYVWAQKEFTNLTRLSRAGVRVPEPIDHEGTVIVMEYIGSEETPAPMLKNARIQKPQAVEVWAALMRDMARMYHRAGLVHADLSEYNVLYHEEPVIIDVGQTVKTTHPMADVFLRRDIGNLTRFFTRFFPVSADETYEHILKEESCDT
ncbi:MAG: serine protein kinase RIO [Candidatus Thermoplasmatota archaeon]|nr:serine protein kinase RIO [Candidatus Thermoplasmatota archaeon]